MIKKYSRICFITIISFFFSINFALAKQVKKKDIGREIEAYNPNVNSVYIIGRYIFTDHFDKEGLKTQDVMLAASSIVIVPSEGHDNRSVAYNKMTIFQLDREFNDEGLPTGNWLIKKNFVGDSSFPDVLELKYIDYNLMGDNYEVTFDDEGFIWKDYVYPNTMVMKPEMEDKTDRAFLGWYLDGELFDFDTPITRDITLEAHWLYYSDIYYKALYDTQNMHSGSIDIISNRVYSDDSVDLISSSLSFSIPNKTLYVEETHLEDELSTMTYLYQTLKDGKIHSYISMASLLDEIWYSSVEEGTHLEILDNYLSSLALMPKLVEAVPSDQDDMEKYKLTIDKSFVSDKTNHFDNDITAYVYLDDGYIREITIDYLENMSLASKEKYKKYEDKIIINDINTIDDFHIPDEVIKNATIID